MSLPSCPPETVQTVNGLKPRQFIVLARPPFTASRMWAVLKDLKVTEPTTLFLYPASVRNYSGGCIPVAVLDLHPVPNPHRGTPWREVLKFEVPDVPRLNLMTLISAGITTAVAGLPSPVPNHNLTNPSPYAESP